MDPFIYLFINFYFIFYNNQIFFGKKKKKKKTCSVNDTPDVWQWVLNNNDFLFFGLNSLWIKCAHNLRPALILAIS